MSRRPARAPFAFGGVEVPAGRRHELSLPISQLVTGADVTLPCLLYTSDAADDVAGV